MGNILTVDKISYQSNATAFIMAFDGKTMFHSKGTKLHPNSSIHITAIPNLHHKDVWVGRGS